MNITQAGDYWGTLTAWGLSKSEKGTPYVWLVWIITHVLGPDDWKLLPQTTEPLKRTIRIYLSDAAWKYSQAKLTALGFNGKFGDDMGFSQALKDDGHKLVASDDTFGGETRLKWDLPMPGGVASSGDQSDLAVRLGAKWQAANAPKPAGGPSAPPAPSASPVPPGLLDHLDHTAPQEEEPPF